MPLGVGADAGVPGIAGFPTAGGVAGFAAGAFPGVGGAGGVPGVVGFFAGLGVAGVPIRVS
jgi:hypothetical protein